MTNFKKKLAATSLAAVIGFAGLPFLTGTADAARPGFDSKKVGGKVVLTTFADAVRLIPYTTSDSASSRIQGMIFDALLTVDIKGNPIPSLATSYSYDKSKLTYTFKLRKGVKFHDGKLMTADDVVFSYQMYTDPKTINSYVKDFETIKQVKKVDTYTVQIILKEKDPLILTNTFVNAAILPKHQFKNGIKDYNTNNYIHRHPIGTGAFKFKEWKSDERIVVTANKDYWDGRPYMDQVITEVLPDANVETINLLKGDVDFVEALNPQSLSQVSKNKNLKIQPYSIGRFDYVGFNESKAPWNNENFRKGLAYGLDRQSMVSKLYLGKATLASGPMHPLIPQNNPSVKPLPFDLKKAAEYLEKAGYHKKDGKLIGPDGKQLTLEFAYNNGNTIRQKAALLAQQNWGKLGIKVTPRSYEWSIFLDKYKEGKLDCFILGWSGYDANVEHSGFFHSTAMPPQGNNNNRINDPQIDKYLDDYKSEEDRSKRIKIYQAMHKYMADHETLIWTYHPKSNAGMDKDLKNVKISMSTAFFNLQDWYWGVASKRK
ncbi:ABC transporter substrate-binding protein [Neobacillus sp. PS3-34]|uniref:ABC transporter substrate-binding protein n=1 Tax=Neobacillus sp. PS3-34 TaxID=3070678 RepID=UPI0027E127E9|nr:ABC transporter substrate-binding protein [Neobacillus sp. PS3-34]WML46906.1 ABC transporter substrate-binding protein [Neobacillus sp. PS3-34]